MLNEHLSEEELQTELKEFLEPYNFIFSQLAPEENVTIYQNKRLLARLHHALNIEKYGQKSFRQRLLIGAPDDKVAEFARRIGARFDTFNETQTEIFRNRLAAFPWGNNDATKAFVEVFNYPEYMVPRDKGTGATSEVVQPSREPFKQLKDYQADIVFRAMGRLEAPNSKFLIQMPTGSGKTRVAMEIISHFLNDGERRHVVWLAERRELCGQAMESFIEVWRHLGRHPVTVRRMWGEANVLSATDMTGFTVAMYQKIRGSLRDGKVHMGADLIVPDEAHTAIAPTYEEVIMAMKERRTRQTRIMGLTATPGRGSGLVEDNEDLSEFFGGVVVGIKSDAGVIEMLRKKRVLAKCNRVPLNTNIRYTLTGPEWAALSNNFEREFPDGLLERIANDEKRNMKIVLRLIDIAADHKHMLVFCGSRKQSKLLCGAMMALKYSAMYVDSDSPPDYRSDVVEKFRAGDIQLLFNYGIFTAGFDAPNIDAVVIARPTASVVLYSQMIGRGMRGSAVGGTDEFLLVDVVDDIITEYGGLDDVYDYFADYWET